MCSCPDRRIPFHAFRLPVTGEEAQGRGGVHPVGHEPGVESLLQPDHSPDCAFPLPGGVCDVHREGVGREGSKATQRTAPWPGSSRWLWRGLEETRAGVGGTACVTGFHLSWNQFQVR